MASALRDGAIPDELIERFNTGNVALFVGDMLGEEMPLSKRLASALANACGAHCDFCREAGRCQKPEGCIELLTRAAQNYESLYNRNTLITFVRRHLETETLPGPIHQALAALPVRIMVTTAYDDRLLTALTDAERPILHIVRDTEIPYDDPSRVQFIRLHGSINQPESLVLTEDDAADLFQRLPTISVILKAHFAHKTLLFLGYRLDDPHFLALYRQVTEPIAPHARLAFAVQWPPDEIATRRWQGKIHAIHQKPLDFLTLLSNSIRPAAPKSRRQPLPSYPYKFLDYFTSDDTAIFHGREHDAERLFSLILANPLSILYGGSGTGKTSLIQAAALPRLRTEGYRIVYTRPLSDPLEIVHKEILKTLDDRSVRSPEVSSLRALVESNLPVDGHLVIVLDQFEEFFIRQGPETRAHFIRELVDLLNISEQRRRVHCLLSLRSDYLDRLDELESCLDRDPLRYRMRLYDLGPDGARAAIAKPASAFGINLEPSLLEQLLVDLRQVDIAPPQLQITCYFLWQDWQKRGKPQSGLTLHRYRELGGTSAILTGYLDNVITELDQREVRNAIGLTLDGPEAQEAARGLLKSMITSEQTKVTVSKGEITRRDLIARLHIAPEQADTLLTYLRNKRIIRLLPDSNRYELAHEVMIEKVWEWVDEEEKHILDLQDMLARAASDYRKFKSLLPPDRLNLLIDQAARLSPSEDALELLLVSAIESNLDPGMWVNKMESARAIEVLAGLLELEKRTRYPQIAKALGYTHSPKAIRYLQDLLGESDEVQRSAAAALGKLGLPDVVRPLYHAVQRENKVNRAAPILEALAALRSDEAANMIMLVASGHTNSQVRSRAANALLRLGYAKDIRWIVRQLNNDDPAIRQDARAAIEKILKESLKEFDAMLHDANPQVRLDAVEALKIVGDKSLWTLLLTVLQDENAEVRRQAVVVLGQLGAERAVEPLLAVLRDEDAEVRQRAAITLGQLGNKRAVEPLLAALQDKDAGVRLLAIRTLGALWELPTLVELGDESTEVRQRAVITLGQLADKRTVEPLLAMLRDEDVGVRRRAVNILEQLGDERTMEPLMMTLLDEDVHVRQGAARALVQLGGIELLLTVLKDRNPPVIMKREIVHMLGRLSDERAVEPLVMALQDEDVEVRRRTVDALGWLRDKRAVEPLVMALQDEDVGVRRRTANALGKLRDRRAMEPLKAALEDKEVVVRQAAQDALKALKEKGEALDEHP